MSILPPSVGAQCGGRDDGEQSEGFHSGNAVKIRCRRGKAFIENRVGTWTGLHVD